MSRELVGRSHGLTEHGDDCGCLRCVGFDSGNGAALRHGCYSPKALAPRAAEIEEQVYASAAWLGPSDTIAVSLLARTVARVELADAAIHQVDERAGSPLTPYVTEKREALDRLRRDMRSWINLATKLAAELGLTAASRARLGLDVARTRDTLADLTAKGREIREGRGET
jgi:hypothetical protein